MTRGKNSLFPEVTDEEEFVHRGSVRCQFILLKGFLKTQPTNNLHSFIYSFIHLFIYSFPFYEPEIVDLKYSFYRD